MSSETQSQIRRRNDPEVDSGPRKAERTRQAILDAALEFLGTRPFRELTVDALMSRTDAGRSAFYQYFADLHDLMETLLRGMRDDILSAAEPWLQGEGNPVTLLQEALSGLVQVCYEQGPIVRAVSDAASTDEKLEKAWMEFMDVFDDAVAERIEQHQAAGLIPEFEARPVAVALNRMDASLLIQQFGRRPRGNRESACDSLTRIWVSTLYGSAELKRLETSRRSRKRATTRPPRKTERMQGSR